MKKRIFTFYLLIGKTLTCFAQSTFPTNGANAGIGTTTPAARLEIMPVAGSGSSAIIHLNGSQAWGHVLTLATDNSAGTDDPRVLFSYRNKAKQWAVGGYNNTTRFSIWEDSGDGTYGTGFGNERLSIIAGGNVGIGTPSPDQKLTVNGTIHASAVKVDVNIPTPDYVFEKNYNLRPLNEVSRYISTYKHLPEVPSAAEMKRAGVDVNEMNMKLLQKVEELTLYLLEKDEQLQKQQRQINKQQTQINQLRKQSNHER